MDEKDYPLIFMPNVYYILSYRLHENIMSYIIIKQ